MDGERADLAREVRAEPAHTHRPRTGLARRISVDAAYSWRKEDQFGSIAPGKIANFTVLDEDPYAVAPEKLKDIPVWGTVFEGKAYPAPKVRKRG